MITQSKVNPYLSLLEIPPGYLNITGYINSSQSNECDQKAIVWLQGCLRTCPGCFNPDSWSFEINQLISIEQLAAQIIQAQNQGVIFSGGEPFWQAPALIQVAQKVKAAGLSVMAVTGFTEAELRSPYAPAKSKELLAELDLLIDGSDLESVKINQADSSIWSNNEGLARLHQLTNSKLATSISI